MDKSSKRGWDKCMETPAKYEQFRVIICAFRKYTTLSAGTASVSSEERHFLRGLQTRAIPAGVSVYFLHFYNQYSSFVSFFLLCPSLSFHSYLVPFRPYRW